ncbi:diguanylate cyclase domain-containing protein [Ferrigenium sp. UT5]|uniref:diguanylate cyclase domain-containing protein n=1 Tax=Ferrigenium sp. UT5 TaxID=3242105 RepID=UPI00354E6F9F
MKFIRALFVTLRKAEVARVADMFAQQGYRMQTHLAGDMAALETALREPVQIVFISPTAKFPVERTLNTLRQRELDIPCILLLQDEAQMTLTEAVRLGARDCVRLQDSQRLVPTVERELVAAALRYHVREQIVTDHLLQEIDQYILHKFDLPHLVKRICQRMVELFGFELVWLGMKVADGSIEIVDAAGRTAYLEDIQVRWDDTPQGRGPAGVSIRENHPVVLGADAPQFAPWRERAGQHGLRCVLSLPLAIDGQVIGVLLMYAVREDAFDTFTVNRLSAFAARVAVAILQAREQQELRLMDVAMRNAANAMFITDCQGRVQWMNQALTRISGYPSGEILGQTPRVFSSGLHEASFWQAMWSRISSGQDWRGDIINRNKSGELFTVTQSVSPLFDEKGELTNFLAVQQDISEKRRLEEEIHHLAYHDILTDLPNRMLFQDRVQQEIIQAKRNKSEFAVLFIDLDGFKAVNDARGHATGDKLLQTIAQRLRSCVRAGDTVARLGGDEFTILLRGVGHGEGLRRVLRKIIKAVAQPCELGEVAEKVTASIGISLYPQDATGVEKLLVHADEAMYHAKQTGKNRWVIYGRKEELPD